MPKGRLTFQYDRCKGCLLCVHFCPVKILEMDRHAINRSGYNTIRVTEPDKCIACAQCATMCPDSVITVEVIDHA